MRMSIHLGILAASSMFLTGCGFGEIPFTISVHNAVTSCADNDGNYDLAFNYEYLTPDGQTEQSDGTAALGKTEEVTLNYGADNDGDGNIDHILVSINLTCSAQAPYWCETTLDNQVPIEGTVAFTEDEFHYVSYTITPPDSAVAKATSAVRQLFGVKPAAKGKTKKSK